MKYLNKTNLLKLKNISSRYPLNELFYKVLEKLRNPYRNYGSEYVKYIPQEEELREQAKTCFPLMPKVSIVVPTYETDELFLQQMIDSVINQTYGNWELCIADGSQSDKVEQNIRNNYAKEKRIVYRRLEKNAGISENTNQGFEIATGEYIALLDHDDLLTPNAVYEMVKCLNETEADFIYSDEDKVSFDLKEYSDPHFKLDFNLELLLGNNYICHFLMVSAELLKKAGGLDSRYDGAQDFEFVLRCSRLAKGIAHVPKVLYHWRVHPASTAGNTNSKLYAYEAGKRAVEDFIVQQGWQGTVTMTRDLGFYRTRYVVPENLVIGVVIQESENGKQKLKQQREKINPRIKCQLEAEAVELKVKLIWDYDNSRKVDYILLLNPDTKQIKPQSLSILLGSCHRQDVAMVGARAVAASKLVHCGYWGKEEKRVPRFTGLPRRFKGYYRRAFLPVEVDDCGNDMAVLKVEALQKTGYRIITDPAAEVTIIVANSGR